MLIRRDFAKHKQWVVGVVAAALLACGAYFAAARHSTELPGGSSPVGLTLGILAGAIILFEFLLWPRKKVRAWRIGSAQTWLRAHIWLGLLSLPLAVLHTGFTFGGPLTAVLLTLFLLVIASGVYGLLLQQFLPRALLEEVPEETIYSQIEYVAERHAWDAEDMVLAVCGPDAEERSKRIFPNRGKRGEAGGVVSKYRRVGSVRGTVLEAKRAVGTLADGGLLRDAFYNDVADYLLHGKRSNSRLVDFAYSARFFADLQGKVEPEAKETVEALEDLCQQRRQFDRQARLHVLLHSWLWVHLPLSAALVVLLAVHIYTALKYS